MLMSPLRYCHHLLAQLVSSGDTVIDATVGNGQDTIKLAQLVGKTGKVYGFDIQETAIEETKKKVQLTGLTEQIKLINDGHEKMNDYITDNTKIQAIVFNLGYLPKGDKSIITLPDTTLSALEQGLNLLNVGGQILMMVYYGHDGGTEEKNAILAYLETLSQEKFSVLQYGFINQKNSPPFLIAIEKRR
ncbi:class I SAM-dependent methyltransferase [Marinilactibacillus psychrotolerans]|uniref:SAM-dependent methyltransferase n=1 Tax=Marinilactibacillus psychrotolerans TaxID=191770 RepID=A0AAV3WRP5_9LACT|nr:class I SAM-dependent methyltransferase [Marinilactibacillus psychrotolerans]GEL68168.1 rRNA methyltransferase [Marinilactibacillus psychrotolerans]GEQ36634.1 SAM-dependent methyltransferase [Marinilactibacillus psychrotolerans]SDD11222.1 Putative rRNA methylase [Marinilactibacillus psychrotolerans]